MPCHHNLVTFLDEYIEAAGIKNDPKGWLFRTTEGQSGFLTDHPMSQADVYRMIRRRAKDAAASRPKSAVTRSVRRASLNI